ncbi:hypothetical protein BS585_19030 [Vibrio parahaemolyticus]|nr:hypothetical protein BS585_19030 [Vibrio parahaemolyticus]
MRRDAHREAYLRLIVDKLDIRLDKKIGVSKVSIASKSEIFERNSDCRHSACGVSIWGEPYSFDVFIFVLIIYIQLFNYIDWIFPCKDFHSKSFF